jgi:WD40 repeat protein/serine/threonine protein kinase/tetratricopeptide (TPR) repeat protein
MELAEAFLDRYRKGERPPLKEYMDRHPELAAEIKEVFPAMAMMENIAVADSSLEGDDAEKKPVKPAEVALKRLGDYRIIREIGHGGMGVVYEAEQVSLGRHVALKVLPKQALADAKQKRRFEREAKAAARLHHTNIVPVFGVGEEEGLPYYVMQFIQGLGLDVVLDELNHMQPGAERTPTGLPTAGEIRISRRSVAAADVARSLLTGAFQQSPDSEPEADAPEQPSFPATLDEPAVGDRSPGSGVRGQESEVSRPRPSSLTPDPCLLTPGTTTRLSDSFTVSSSSIILPGSGATTGTKSGGKKQTYWQSVANIGRQVADALDYAHKQGILHRDVKPSNLLLDLRGTVWVTDFGLAKVAAPGADNLTHTGDILGTLRYMPPEMFEGKSDARGDVYSLGLTMYELLALRPAFGEKDRNKLIKHVTTGEPAPLHKIKREAPRDLVTIIHKAIDREPGRRYATAEDMASDLQRFLEDEPILARRQTQLERYWRWARHNPGMAVLGTVLTAVLVLATLASLIVAGRMATLADNAKQSQQETEKALTQVAWQKTELESQKVAVESSLTKAEKAEQVARAAEDEGRKLLYATDMQLAPFIWKDPQATAAQLRQRLDAHDPVKNNSLAGKDDLRGFEWHYFHHLLEHSATVLNAGTAAITDFAVADDGSLVTVDQQGRLKKWDPDTHRHTASLDAGPPPPDVRANEQRFPNRHPRALSPHGRRLASAVGKTVRVHDTTTGVLSYQFEASLDLLDLIFSRDGRFLVTHDGWFDAATGQALAHFDQALANKDSNRMQLSLSADGLTLAVGAQGPVGNLISIFHLDQTTKKVTPPAEPLNFGGSMSTAALSPDGKLIAVGSHFTGSVSVYETATAQQIAALGSAHTSAISAIAFSANGLDLATADVEGIIKTWGNARKLTSTSEAQRTLKGHAAAVTKVAFSTGKQFISASLDGTVRLWELEQLQPTARRLPATTTDPVFFAGGRLIATAERNRVIIWDAASGQRLRSLAEGGTILGLAVSPDNRLLAVGRFAENGPAPPFRPSFVTLWEMDTGRRVAEFFNMDYAGENHSAYCAAQTLTFSPDGKFLVAGYGLRGSHFSPAIFDMKVWEVATLRELTPLRGHSNACVSICFSPDGKRMASGSHDGTARIWDTATWQAVGGPLTTGNPEVGDNSVEAVAFSPDGRTLAMATMGGRILLWNLKTRRQTALPRAHANAVNSIAFSPDGRTLASGSSDETIRLWNVATGRELMILNSKDLNLGQVQSLSFSPDGMHLLASGSSLLVGSVVVWSAAPSDWDNATVAANQLRPLLSSPADFQNRVRIGSEIPRLSEALELLDANDRQVQAAVAAIRANRFAQKGRWAEAAKEYDRLKGLSRDEPQAWLRTPGLIRVATALFHEGRPAQAAALLTGGAARRRQDGLPLVTDTVLGFAFQRTGEAIRIAQLVPGSPAAHSNLRVNDVLLKINDVAVTDVPVSKIAEVLKREAGIRVRLTVRHPKDDRTEVIELSRVDPESEELWRPLLAAIDARLAKEPRDAALLELRAELSGQWSGFADQVRDYTAAIDVLASQPKAKVEANLQRLHRRRGDAHFHLKQWQAAVDDYARSEGEGRGVSGEGQGPSNERKPRGETGLAHQPLRLTLFRRAQAYEQLRNWQAASTNWTRALEANSDAGRLHAEFAGRLLDTNQPELAASHRKQARTHLEARLAREPENAVLATELADVLLLQETRGWTVLKPTEMKSAGGATLTLLEDGSILSSGKHPQTDDYIVQAPVGVNNIRAIALDVLPHETVNGGSVGYGNAGLFVLERIELSRPDRSGGRQSASLTEAVADSEVSGGWGSGAARTVIDGGNKDQGWVAVPLFEPHRLVVKPGQPIVAGKTPLQCVIRQHLRQQHGRLIGRFRLSVSDDPAAFEREQKRFAAMKLNDPWAKLGAAYALHGRQDVALPYLRRALEHANDYEARKPIIEFAARFDEVLSVLVQRQPDDPQLQLAMARKLAGRGKQHLSEKRPREAQAELEKSREIYRRLRAKYPAPHWTVPPATELKSDEGENLTVEKDGSIFVGGLTAARTVYRLKLRTDLPTLTAIRLETIPDARLPAGGAGRYAGGNVSVGELTAAFEPRQARAKATPIVFASASADMQQHSPWGRPANVLDGNPDTNWFTHSRQLQSHWVIVGLATPVQTDGGCVSITLHSNLGRFRLSVTSDAEALRAAQLHNDVKDSEVADLNVALAKAHARQGHVNEAVASLTAALDRTADRAGKAKIITEATSLEGALEKLGEHAAGDAQFQAELARYYAERGKVQRK